MDSLKPTADYGVRPAAMDKPEPAVRTGKDIALEPEPYGKSKQVCELAAPCIAEGVLVEFEGMEAHNPATVDINNMASGNYLEDLLEVFEEAIPF